MLILNPLCGRICARCWRCYGGKPENRVSKQTNKKIVNGGSGGWLVGGGSMLGEMCMCVMKTNRSCPWRGYFGCGGRGRPLSKQGYWPPAMQTGKHT